MTNITNKTINILLVEDHEFTRLGLAMKIDNTPHFNLVAQAVDGLEGVELAQKYNPDVVLMDIGLPKMDGISATRKIKEDLKLGCAVLMFTSRDSKEDIFAAFKAGADGYIMKGSSSQNLINAIDTVSEHAAWIDSQIARVVLSSIQNENEIAVSSKNQKEANKKYGLTKKELEVLALIVDGLSNQEISEKLVVSMSTTKAHVHNILQKLYLKDRTKAAIIALKEGLV
ncbi:MAG: response regulator transcription factor [Candidatus Gastranaerophilales bacterium]|nr:response regulator transcription factor [Candidatus Gastranaerophilales bacterium]